MPCLKVTLVKTLQIAARRQVISSTQVSYPVIHVITCLRFGIRCPVTTSGDLSIFKRFNPDRDPISGLFFDDHRIK